MIKLVKNVFVVIVLLVVITKVYFVVENYFYDLKQDEILKNRETSMGVIEHRKLKIDGSEIHYYVSGEENEKSIIFLHPAFSDHTAFSQQVSYFSKDYKVITIDLIGHGLSKANKSKEKIDASSEHIFKILELENIERTNLVGVSMGALIAQYFAFEYPNKTNTITALGGYSIHKENKEVANTQRGSIVSLLFRAIFSMKSFAKKAAEMSCKSVKGKTLFYKSLRFYERKSFLVMGGLQNVVKERVNIVTNYPKLIMVGEFDIKLAKDMAKEWHSQITNSEYYSIENGGHCANIDEPLLFNQKLKVFLDKNN